MYTSGKVLWDAIDFRPGEDDVNHLKQEPKLFF